MNIFSGNSIHRRFTFTLAGTIAFIILVVSATAILRNINTIDTQLEKRLADVTKLAERSLPIAIWRFNDEYVNDFVESLLLYEDIVFVKVSAGNRVIKEKTRQDIHQRDFTFLKQSSNYKVKKTDIRYERKTIGEIQIAATRERIQKTIINNSYITIILMVMIISAILLITYYISRKHIFNPLLNLENSATEIAGGDLDVFIDTSGTDEIGHLAKTFDQMIKNLKKITASRDELNHEITERKQTEAALRESEKRFRGLFNDSPIMYVITEERDGLPIVKDINNRFLNQLGYSRKEVIGNSLDQYYTKESAYELLEGGGYQIALRGSFTEAERSLVARNGEIIYTLVRVVPEKDKPGKSLRVRSTYLDITARKQAETEKEKALEQLSETEKMGAIGTLTAGIAHEMNNPMMGILNFIQYCLKHTSKNDKLYKILQDAEHSTYDCIKIVKNLLTFSRIEKEEEEEYKKESLAVVLNRVLDLLAYRIEIENISVIQQIQEGTPLIPIKVTNMQQVFLNLVGNALDALKDNDTKEIQIDTGLEDGFAQIIIRDSGSGIHPEDLPKIFDPFFTTKPVGEGTGLGLSVCRGIVEGHGGKIGCESEVGKGTIFRILLPVEQKSS